MGYVQRISNYDAERDTTIRVGFKHLFTSAAYIIRPRASEIARHTFKLENYTVLNPDNSFNENDLTADYEWN
jgi:hypothetical protein